MREAVPAMPREQPFAPDRLRWRVFDALGRPGGTAEAPLRRYLADGDARKRFELADRLARVYDRCLLYRPEWIRAWEAGETPHWQARLWRRLTEGVPTPAHWVAAVDAFREAAEPSAGEREGGPRQGLAPRMREPSAGEREGGPRQGLAPREKEPSAGEPAQPPVALELPLFDKLEERQPTDKPRRVSFFGIGMLSPSYLDVLRAAESYIDIHLFVLSPCREYWSDIAPKRVIRRRAAPRRPEDDYRIEGNELLAALGKPARDMQALLAERELALGSPEESYDESSMHTALGMVQNDMLNLRTATEGAAEAPAPTGLEDSSLQIHACHSAMREAEVLHDRLLALFDEHPDLEPADVLVVTPNPGKYGPAIDSVFATAERIPFHLARRPAAGTRGLRALLDLLALPGSRYGAEAVLAPLECASVRARIGIPEERLASVREWVRNAGIRWGVDGAHRRDEGLPGVEGHAWRLGLRRLLLGYAMDDQDTLFEGMAPCPMRDGGLPAGAEDYEALGCFARYCDDAFALRDWLDEACPAREWGARLRESLVARFFAGDEWTFDDEARRETAAVLRCIDEWETQCEVETPIPFRVVRQALGEAAGAEDRMVARLADGVTVTRLGAGQTFPARVVCAVGMNDRSFPRSPGAPTFDILAADEERRGDRNVRDEDRFAFLEALLAARRAFLVTYTGRGLRDDAPIPPSVVVDELREYLARRFDGVEFEVRHPLQAFSRRYFDDSEEALYSYSDHMRNAAEALVHGQDGVPGRLQVKVDAVSDAEPAVDLDTLTRFFGAPARWFLQRRLAARLEVEEVALEEDEPFGLDGLARWQLRDRMWGLRSRGVDAPAAARLASAEPTLPEAALGTIAVTDAADAVDAFHAAMTEHAGALAAPPLPIDLLHGDMRVTGVVEAADAEEDYLVWWRIGSIRAKDRVDGWLKLLAWILAGDRQRNACLLGLGSKGLESAWLQGPPPDEAAGLWTAWLDAWAQGQSRLLPFAPETSWAYATAIAKPKRNEDGSRLRFRAKRAAENKWFGSQFGFPEANEAYAALAYDGGGPVDDPSFEPLARSLLLPLVEAGRKVRP
ncbi:MAG: exonuclease V subunit gamma [Gammaproteobacteria bacterium]|nr:exonuclease V subunit gamma [Gammaproteobacteria bacterium]